MTDERLLTLDDVSVGYGRHVVLANVSLGFQRGDFVGLLGANGCGKTTLLKTILGILPPLDGRLSFQPVHGRPPVLGYVPQREALDPIYPLSAFEVVLMGTCGRVGPGRRIGQSEKDWAHQCLRQSSADELSRQRFSRLSGGQKQRVLIARALATRPDLLVLDEPTAGIDAAATQAIMQLLRRIHGDQRMTIVMASHDLAIARRYMREIIWLHQGRLLQGAVAELLSREKIAEFLGLELT